MNNIKLCHRGGIPQIGLGTWQLTDRDILRRIVAKAYENGYRLIDTAAAYSNEIGIAKAIEAAGISRKEFFISDKVWNTYRGIDGVRTACEKSLKKLKTDYLDLYLIHWPASEKLYANWEEINAETWRGMERLLKDGLVRAIGVCNFKTHHLEELKKTAQILPLVNQIEYHPGMNQTELLQYCNDNGIQVEASSPLGNGKILENELLKNIALRKEKTVAQICLRWGIEKKLVVLPRTSREERLKSNIDIWNFELTDDEIKIIDSIPYCGGIGIDSDEVTEVG